MWSALISWGTRLLGGSSLFKWLGIGVAFLAVAALAVWLGWSRAEYRADFEAERAVRVQIQAAYEAHAAALQGLRADVQAQGQALAEREQTIKTINAERRAMRQRLREAMHNDETVRNWGNTPLPDAVRRLLQ